MKLFDTIAAMGHEQLVLCQDSASGYRGIIAVHSTMLGPALGGTRFWNYATDEEAIVDALRLARGMTYKNAVAGLNLGGGKSVIIGDNKTTDREMIFRAHGRFVESLGGRYITAEDVGTSTADMDYVHMETDYVERSRRTFGRSVAGDGARRVPRDPGVGEGALGLGRSLERKTIAIQGCGHVGYYLAKELHEAGAKLIVTDIDAERVKRVVDGISARGGGLDEIYGVAGGHLRALRARRDHQRQDDSAAQGRDRRRRGEQPAARGAARRRARGARDLYAPDYVANAGGVINVYGELAGWTSARSFRKADEIYDTMLKVFEIAKTEKIPTYLAADRLAEQRIRAVGSMVRTWPQWPNK